ncbi:MAG: DUF134 domain-containing protein [Thermodesulfobacteriota bacterium]
MPRPPKCRTVQSHPYVTYFKPAGLPLRDLAETHLSVDGLEALRLADLEGLRQEEAAARMKVSRPTFGRILAGARRTVAEAVVRGQALCIEGGHYSIEVREKETEGGLSWPGPGKDLGAGGPGRGRVAVGAEGGTLEDRVAPRFGRAAGFILVDPETLEFDYLDGGPVRAGRRKAGVRAAELLARSGVSVVLTGQAGQAAVNTLTAAGLEIHQGFEGLTVREAVARFQEGLTGKDSDQERHDRIRSS